MNIRKATAADINEISAVYEKIHTAEEKGEAVIGWKRGIYPTAETATDALERGDLFVMEENRKIIGTGIINKIQVDVYSDGNWKYKADDSEIMVLHTLVISPEEKGKGYGRRFVDFYESYGKENGCKCLRMDTNEKNTVARAMYKKLGYDEIGIVPCIFNGLNNVNLVLLEKSLG